MQILLIHTYYSLRGGEDSVFEQEYNLLKKDNEVEVITFQNKSGSIGALQFLSSIWNILAAYKVKKKLKQFQPDIIHIHNWHFASGPLIMRSISKKKIPFIITLHNYRLLCPSAIFLCNGKIFRNSISSNFPWTAIKNKVYRNSYIQTFWLAFIVWFHKKIDTWDRANRYIVLTEFARKIYISSHININNNKFIIKQNFSKKSISNFEYKNKIGEFLFIGRLSQEKGIDCLIQAFKGTNYIINIGGDGPLKEKIIDASKLFPNIKYLGKLNETQVIKYLNEMEALILPSVCYEGMPMTITEAFSVGVPVIASNLGAMSSMIKDEHNGLLFEPGNSDSLIQKLNEWQSKSEEEKKQFSLNAYNTYLEYYTPEKNKELLMNIYIQTINEANKTKND